ncbi:MAG: cysteine desulfurase NifS [Lachnospira sp.]|nr:cysteine desulfurase NifS [Lachnospira sp.]
MIYLDNAATTRVVPEVFEVMKEYFGEEYANPAAVYTFASGAGKAVGKARAQIEQLIGAGKDEVYFTSGGTESDNWAIKGVAESYAGKGKHIITSVVEHHAVLHTCKYLEKKGFEITYIGVDEYGVVKMEELEQAIREDTILISIMMANNEIGTIQPVAEIGRLARKHGVLFHTDAVQACGHIPIDVNAMNIDLLSGSGHKFHGPKGVGFLYVRKGVKLGAYMHGGAQENRRRAGTHNVTGIAGMGAAAELAMVCMEDNMRRQAELREYLIERVIKEIPYCRINGHRSDRLPGNVHFCFRFIEGEAMLMMLDSAGICASSGSACTSGSLDPSHVLLAIGLPHEIAHGSLRLSMSEETTKEELDYVVDKLKVIIARLREMSPLYEDFMERNNDKEA